MSEEFYVVLPSNASYDIYKNKLSSFTVRLPTMLNLGPEWQVATVSISYPKSWFNIGEGYTLATVTPQGGRYRATIPPGNYEHPQDLIDEINRSTAAWPGSIRFKIDKQKLKIDNLPPSLKMSENLAQVLGYINNKSVRPIYLDQGLNSLYVYSDIVYPSIIGDTTGPLLRVVHVPSKTTFGQQVTEYFDPPYYYPLAHFNFQEITCYIRTDTGVPPPFRFGRVVITLHFKKT
jgi:hypothetical protein